MSHSQFPQPVAFIPQSSEWDLPAVRVGEVLVFVYVDDDGIVRVKVDTDDVTDPTGVAIQVEIDDDLVWAGAVPS